MELPLPKLIVEAYYICGETLKVSGTDILTVLRGGYSTVNAMTRSPSLLPSTLP